LTEGVTDSRFKLGAWFVAEDRNTVYDGSSEVDNPHNERTQIRVPLMTLDVRFSQQFGIQGAVTLPDVTRTATNFKETFSGLGDTSVIGWYRLRPRHRWYAVLNFGGSLPTGKTEQPRFRSELQDGDLVPLSRLQRGSGTLDPLFGASLTRVFAGTTVFSNVAARTPVSENSTGLRTGASSEVNGGIARELGSHRVTGFTRVGWLHRQQDVFQGTPVLVGGGNWLYVTPGVAVQVGRGVNVQAELKMPVYRSLANLQLDSAAIFQFRISRGF
jgi:hypothetical protein